MKFVRSVLIVALLSIVPTMRAEAQWPLWQPQGSTGVKTIGNRNVFLYDSNASHLFEFDITTNATAARTISWAFGDSDRTITLSGNPTLSDWFDQEVKAASSPTFAGVTLGNTGLHILDTNASHDLIVAPGSDVTADRTLTITTGDSDRTVTLGGNVTLDQDVDTTASPTFVGGTFSDDVSIGADSKSLILGAGSDAKIYYDGSHLWIDPNDVGSGLLKIYDSDFDCRRAAAHANFTLYCYSDTSTHAPYFTLQKSHSDTLDTAAETLNTEVLGRLTYKGIDTGASAEQAAMIECTQDGNAGVRVPGKLSFQTATSTVNVTERMSIASTAITAATKVVFGTTEVSAAGPTDNVDVQDVNVVFIDTADPGNNVTIGGFVNGVAGQVIRIVRLDTTNDVTLEHAEGTGNQDIYLADEADQAISTYGGWTLVCNGSHWYEVGY